MRLLLVFVLLTGTAMAETVNIKLKVPGRYIITLTTPESCTPSAFSISASETGFGEYPVWYLKASVTPIVMTAGGAAVCREGNHTASGLVTIASETVLEVDLSGAGGLIVSPTVKVEKISATRIIR